MDTSILTSTLFMTIFLMIFSCDSSTFPIVKSGCEDQAYCGNVSLPFPFGTRKDCYLNEKFMIQCRNSTDGVSHPTKPFLGDGNLDVMNITLDGHFRVFFDVGYDCYDPNNATFNEYSSPNMIVSENFFFNSSANKFTAIGCDFSATVEGESKAHNYTTGCKSLCYSEEDVIGDSCSGIGCCQTSIPNGAWKINITLETLRNHTRIANFNPCSYSFVVEEARFNFSADNLTNIDKSSSVPVLVDWVVAEGVKCEEAKQNTSSYACKSAYSVCEDQKGDIGYRCRCKDGFEGNPYLSVNGCRDINECEKPSLHNCQKHSSCRNTAGNYTCQCDHGYHGDGRKDEGCTARRNQWPVIGVSSGSATLLLFSFLLYYKLMKRKEKKLREEFFEKNGGLILQERLLAGKSGFSNNNNNNATRIFTVKELQKATNDFNESNIIGRGGFGIVFKGELTGNKKVAIKKSRGVDERQVELFINEVIILSQINNRNVVKLLGCCLETEVPLLVYEFIDNGTLSEHLSDKIKASKLSWDIRLRIATEVAGVLSYLHSVASPPIIHRDIKSANILLDQNYTAKVADFGISRLLPMGDSQVSTMVQGTHGYLDPEYLQTGLLTEKSDVYSFGIVLVEILTGRKVLASDGPETEKFLPNYFLSSVKSGELGRVFDGNVNNSENVELLKEVAIVAEKCVSVKGEDRPYMKDVARELEALRITTQEFISQALDVIDSPENEALLGINSIKFATTDSER
ncbi:OLC1v1015663C1 [Oldenlandia corymbosa var. corymbosa]|uniref:OLC1v1015663C1 n=1 Tax=Oldenlandia corymbosa var. corymbosa TaxID=529605 RepID=A0AAV1E6U3_OLDCO|nr:OLC1v1015663C1 [Oldenlandia corymbosa var. corymbosa]